MATTCRDVDERSLGSGAGGAGERAADERAGRHGAVGDESLDALDAAEKPAGDTLLVVTDASAPRSTTFRVAARIDGIGGDGHLTVRPRALVLEPDRFAAWVMSTPVRQIMHDDDTVTVISTRLIPWFGTHLVLRSGNRVAIASVGVTSRRRLLDALGAAGFTIDRKTKWISTGGAYLQA